MTPAPSHKISRRIRLMEILFGIIMVLLGIRAMTLQLFNADELADKANKDLVKIIEIQGKRGDILDRHMKKLSTSLDAISIAAAPEEIKTPGITAHTLAPLLHMDASLLAGKLSSTKKFVWLKKNFPPGKAKRLRI